MIEALIEWLAGPDPEEKKKSWQVFGPPLMNGLGNGEGAPGSTSSAEKMGRGKRKKKGEVLEPSSPKRRGALIRGHRTNNLRRERKKAAIIPPPARKKKAAVYAANPNPLIFAITGKKKKKGTEMGCSRSFAWPGCSEGWDVAQNLFAATKRDRGEKRTPPLMVVRPSSLRPEEEKRGKKGKGGGSMPPRFRLSAHQFRGRTLAAVGTLPPARTTKRGKRGGKRGGRGRLKEELERLLHFGLGGKRKKGKERKRGRQSPRHRRQLRRWGKATCFRRQETRAGSRGGSLPEKEPEAAVQKVREDTHSAPPGKENICRYLPPRSQKIVLRQKKKKEKKKRVRGSAEVRLGLSSPERRYGGPTPALIAPGPSWWGLKKSPPGKKRFSFSRKKDRKGAHVAIS